MQFSVIIVSRKNGLVELNVSSLGTIIYSLIFNILSRRDFISVALSGILAICPVRD